MKNFTAIYQMNGVGFLPPEVLLKSPHRRMIFCVTFLPPAPSLRGCDSGAPGDACISS